MVCFVFSLLALNIEKIIVSCLRQDQASFKKLYETYCGYCYTLCIKLGLQEEDCKDCVQVIFTEVFQCLDRYDSNKAQFKTWFTRISLNKAIDYKKKHNYYTQVRTTLDETKVNLPTQMEYDNTDHDMIIRVLAKMPHQFIDVFNLNVFYDKSHKEIAELLGITESHSRVCLFRGREWAKHALKSLTLTII